MPYIAFINRKMVEPPYRNRLARYKCPIEGCTAPVIASKGTCKECNRKIPRRFARAIDATLKASKRWTEGDGPELRRLLSDRHYRAWKYAIEALEKGGRHDTANT